MASKTPQSRRVRLVSDAWVRQNLLGFIDKLERQANAVPGNRELGRLPRNIQEAFEAAENERTVESKKARAQLATDSRRRGIQRRAASVAKMATELRHVVTDINRHADEEMLHAIWLGLLLGSEYGQLAHSFTIDAKATARGKAPKRRRKLVQRRDDGRTADVLGPQADGQMLKKEFDKRKALVAAGVSRKSDKTIYALIGATHGIHGRTVQRRIVRLERLK